MDNADKSERLFVWLLVAEFLLVIVCSYFWNSQSDIIYRTDSSIHAYNAMMRRGDWRLIIGKSASPLIYFLSLPFILIFGIHTKVPFWAFESLWLAVLTAATYLVGKEMRSPKMGYIAATLLLFTSEVTVSLRTFFMDYPIGAMFMCLWLFYLRSNKLQKTSYTVAFFLTLAVIVSLRSHSVLLALPFLFGILIDQGSLCQLSKWRYYCCLLLVLLVTIGSVTVSFYLDPDVGLVFLGFIFSEAILMLGLVLWHFKELRVTPAGRFLFLLGCTSLVVIAVHTLVEGGEAAERYVDSDIFLGDSWIVPNSILTSLSLVSLWLRGVLVELHNKQLGPILIHLFNFGLLLMLALPRRRQNNWPLLCCALLVPTSLSLLTCNDVRYQFTFVCFACLIAADGLCLLGRYAYPLMLVHVSVGLCLMGGWLVPSSLERLCPIPQTKAIYMHNELVHNAWWGGPAYSIAISPFTNDMTYYGLASHNYFENLLCLGSAWNRSQLWVTAPPYKSPWSDFWQWLHRLVPKSSIILVHEAYPIQNNNINLEYINLSEFCCLLTYMAAAQADIDLKCSPYIDMNNVRGNCSRKEVYLLVIKDANYNNTATNTFTCPVDCRLLGVKKCLQMEFSLYLIYSLEKGINTDFISEPDRRRLR